MTAKIHHADIYGTRADKYQTLLASDLESVDWQELSPNVPFYLFMPQEQAYREEYEQGWKVTDIFPINVLGFQTHRDQFAIDFDQEALRQRITTFRSMNEDDARKQYQLGTWDVAKAQGSLRAELV